MLVTLPCAFGSHAFWVASFGCTWGDARIEKTCQSSVCVCVWLCEHIWTCYGQRVISNRAAFWYVARERNWDNACVSCRNLWLPLFGVHSFKEHPNETMLTVITTHSGSGHGEQRRFDPIGCNYHNTWKWDHDCEVPQIAKALHQSLASRRLKPPQRLTHCGQTLE